MLCALQIYVRPDIQHLLVQHPSGTVTLHVPQVMSQAAGGLLLEIEHGRHWATPDEWRSATLVLRSLGGEWHNVINALVWPQDFVLPDLPPFAGWKTARNLVS